MKSLFNILKPIPNPNLDAALREVQNVLEKARPQIGGKLDLLLGDSESSEKEAKGIFAGDVVQRTEANGNVSFTRTVGVLPNRVTASESRTVVVDGNARIPNNAEVLILSVEVGKSTDRDLLIFSTTGPVSMLDGNKAGMGQQLSAPGGQDFYEYVGGGNVTEKVFIDVQSGRALTMWTAYMVMEPGDNTQIQLNENLTMTVNTTDVERSVSGEPMRVRKVEKGFDGIIVVSDGLYYGKAGGYKWESVSEVKK